MSREELRRLAEAAPPGPWMVDGDVGEDLIVIVDDGCDTSFTQITGDIHQGDGGWSDAAYIAAANPAAVLDLLDQLDAAEGRLVDAGYRAAEDQAEIHHLRDQVSRLTRERDEWEANEQTQNARADAAEARLAEVQEMVHRGARCPMCSSGMERRTVGMVCQLCGTDYGRADA